MREFLVAFNASFTSIIEKGLGERAKEIPEGSRAGQLTWFPGALQFNTD